MTNYVVPQNYPLFAWYLDVDADDRQALRAHVEREGWSELEAGGWKNVLAHSGPHRVIAWEWTETRRPLPIVLYEQSTEIQKHLHPITAETTELGEAMIVQLLHHWVEVGKD